MGERGATSPYASWMVLSGQMANSAPAPASLRAEESMSSATKGQSPPWIGTMYRAREWVCIVSSGWSCSPIRGAASAQIDR